MEQPSARVVAKRATQLGLRNIRPQLDGWLAGKVTLKGVSRYLAEATSRAADEALPAPTYSQLFPRSNTAAAWLIVIGCWTAAGSVSVAPQPALFIAVASLGIALAVIGIRRWESSRSRADLVRRTREADEHAWRQSRQLLAAEAEDLLWAKVSEALAMRLGVPIRLHKDFERELRANRLKRRGEWRVDWWASQSEYPPAPAPSPRRLSHDAYEALCAQWLRSVGWISAKTTRYSRDGGVDVVADEYAVQCKHYDGGYVGARDVREIFGVATAHGKTAALITSGRFTSDATAFAAKASVALLVLDERTMEARALNAAARSLIAGPTSH